eukprot:scaffold6237_cov336-Prasinococcus_capsulatus_cf.AAC.4
MAHTARKVLHASSQERLDTPIETAELLELPRGPPLDARCTASTFESGSAHTQSLGSVLERKLEVLLQQVKVERLGVRRSLVVWTTAPAADQFQAPVAVKGSVHLHHVLAIAGVRYPRAMAGEGRIR